MARRIALQAMALILMAGTTLAGAHPGGIARELAMGGGPLAPTGFGPNIALNPFIYEDPTLMLLNPAYQQMYRSAVLIPPRTTDTGNNLRGRISRSERNSPSARSSVTIRRSRTSWWRR